MPAVQVTVKSQSPGPMTCLKNLLVLGGKYSGTLKKQSNLLPTLRKHDY